MLLFVVFAEKCGRNGWNEKERKRERDTHSTHTLSKRKYKSRTCKQNKTKPSQTELNETKTNTCYAKRWANSRKSKII